MAVAIAGPLLADTYARLRSCGGGRRECQAIWVGPWSDPHAVTRVVHPEHTASAGGFQVGQGWLAAFWDELADRGEGVRVQVHTHPGAAYHSATDDAFPLLSTPGFLSLVIPRFAQGTPDLAEAFLAQLGDDGVWREVPITEHLEVT